DPATLTFEGVLQLNACHRRLNPQTAGGGERTHLTPARKGQAAQPPAALALPLPLPSPLLARTGAGRNSACARADPARAQAPRTGLPSSPAPPSARTRESVRGKRCVCFGFGPTASAASKITLPQALTRTPRLPFARVRARGACPTSPDGRGRVAACTTQLLGPIKTARVS